MVKEILLQNGMVALVDDEDYERCIEHVWTVHKVSNTTLNVITEIDKRFVSISRFILELGAQDERFVHFKDRNQLNYQKTNLIIGDRQMSAIRRRGRINSSSKYKGVFWDKSRSKWRVAIRVEGKNKYFGYHENEEYAARIYNEVALKYFGEHAYQNIIGEDNSAVKVEVEVGIKQGHRRKNSNTTSQYRGVSQKKTTLKWGAFIKVDGKSTYLGSFDSEKQAAKAYDKKAYELHGDKAMLNFPELIEEYKKPLLQ